MAFHPAALLCTRPHLPVGRALETPQTVQRPGCIGAAPGFTVTDDDGTVYTFNPNPHANVPAQTASTFPFPSTIEDRNGNTMTLAGGQSNGNGGYTPI